jgi:hypothetical protein
VEAGPARHAVSYVEHRASFGLWIGVDAAKVRRSSAAELADTATAVSCGGGALWAPIQERSRSIPSRSRASVRSKRLGSWEWAVMRVHSGPYPSRSMSRASSGYSPPAMSSAT